MKSKPRQSRPPDKHAQPSRVSERIAERPSRQPSSFTVYREPRIKKQVTAPKITQSHQKKAALSKPRQAAQKKQITPKRSQQSRQEKAKKASIFREALEEHEKRTANEPLPDELAKWKSDIAPLESDEMPSTHDPLMPSKLTQCGVFDEQWDEHAEEIEKPHNFEELISGMISEKPIDRVRKEDILEYQKWFETISVPSYGEADATDWCKRFLDIDFPALNKPHFKSGKMTFKAPTGSQILEYTPQPDYTEGLAVDEMPSWIIESLKCYVRPSSEMVIPNFIAEFKGKGDMQIAHQQVRLDGGVAAQGYFKLLTLCNVGEDPYGKALVGTIESNAETIVGNIHWATKSRHKSRTVEYHMRRVFHYFTRGIDRRDFLRCREQARRFRQYFRDMREDILDKLRRLSIPSLKPRSYSNYKLEQLKTLCRERNLPISGNKADLVKRLKAGSTVPSNPITPRLSPSQTSSRASMAMEENIRYSFTEQSTKRRRDRLEDEEPRHSKR